MTSLKAQAHTRWATGLVLVACLLSAQSPALGAEAQTYGTQGPHAAPRPATPGQTVHSTALPCKNCGWVESCNWVESPDPVLVGAAASGRFSAQGQMLQGDKAGTAVSIPGNAQPAHYDIRIRMADGSLRLIQQAEPLPLGAEVRLQGSVARLLHE